MYKLRIAKNILKPFYTERRLDKPLLAIYCCINLLVLINTSLHDATIGYDAISHLEYIENISAFRLPTPMDTREFFSPPLPYIIPGLILAITKGEIFWAAKIAQWLNVVVSLMLTYYLIKLCNLIGGKPIFKRAAIGFLMILPVYYKSFSYIRGEPYNTLFSILIAYLLAKVFHNQKFPLRDGLILGIFLGLNALARQWGILLFLAVYASLARLWLTKTLQRREITGSVITSLVLSLLIGGWFYMISYSRYGTVLAFNRKPTEKFLLSNQPLMFYAGLSGLMFRNPIRPNFPNQFIPILYSEMWGDYWGFFIVYGLDVDDADYLNGTDLLRIREKGKYPRWIETNIDTIGSYLGRVNLVSLLPSALAILAVFRAGKLMVGESIGRREPIVVKDEVAFFTGLAVLLSIVGYLWFLIRYPNLPDGDTIKATYILQIFPMVGLFVGDLAQKIEQISQRAGKWLLLGLAFIALHNLPAMITHYSILRLLFLE